MTRLYLSMKTFLLKTILMTRPSMKYFLRYSVSTQNGLSKNLFQILVMKILLYLRSRSFTNIGKISKVGESFHNTMNMTSLMPKIDMNVDIWSKKTSELEQNMRKPKDKGYSNFSRWHTTMILELSVK